jgi:hypothetical protein
MNKPNCKTALKRRRLVRSNRQSNAHFSSIRMPNIRPLFVGIILALLAICAEAAGKTVISQRRSNHQ